MSSSIAHEATNYNLPEFPIYPPQLHHLPSGSAISPTSKTQSLLSPGSFPASESPVVDSPTLKPPAMTLREALLRTPGHAFELKLFNTPADAYIHSEPKLRATALACSPMERLFQKIEENDRLFVQQIPFDQLEQLEQGFFINQARASKHDGFTPLTRALTLGHFDLAVDLLLRGASAYVVDAKIRQPLRILANDSIVRMIIKFMALEANQGKSNSTHSISRGQYQKLLTQVDPQSGHTLLTWAIRYRHPKLVEKLINAGADLRVCNRFGRAALAEACAFGCMETVAIILNAWPELVRDEYRAYLIAGIESAVMADRRMVIAELLCFFRSEFRDHQNPPSTRSKYDWQPEVPSNPLAEEEALRAFLGARPQREISVPNLMKRTSDALLLTGDESRLLKLNKMLALAQKWSLPGVIEIIHAHAMISDIDTDSDGSSV